MERCEQMFATYHELGYRPARQAVAAVGGCRVGEPNVVRRAELYRFLVRRDHCWKGCASFGGGFDIIAAPDTGLVLIILRRGFAILNLNLAGCGYEACCRGSRSGRGWRRAGRTECNSVAGTILCRLSLGRVESR